MRIFVLSIINGLFVVLLFNLMICTICLGASFDLGEVVVTAKKQAISKTTTTSEVTSEDIDARGCKTIDEALELVPGVNVVKGGKGEMHVFIRGFSDNDVKILIDGVPVYETYFHTLDLSQFPVDSIAKIKVIKGASSVLYGANTMGGVINIITKKGSAAPFTKLSASFGDYGTQNYSVSHGGQRQKINYFLAYSYQKSDGYRLSSDFDEKDKYNGLSSPFMEDGGKRDLSDYEKSAFNGKLGYDTSDAKLYLSFDYHNNKRGIPTEYYRYWRFTKWDEWMVNLAGERKIGENINIRDTVFYVDLENEISSYTDKNCDTLGGKWFDKSEYDDYLAGNKFEVRLQTSNINLFTLGFTYVFEEHRQREFNTKDKNGNVLYPGWSDWEKFQTETYTFAIEDEFTFGPFTITPGFSYNKLHPIKSSEARPRDDIDSLDPQLGVLYLLDSTTTLHASVGKKTRFPHMKELYSEKGGGNPHLKEQHTTAFEIGGEKYFYLKNWEAHFNISYFYNNIRDLIGLVDLPTGDPQYQNIGKARIQGVETSVDLKPRENLWTEVSYTYLWAKDDDKDRRLENIPQHKIDGEIRYRFNFGLNFNVQTSYVHGQYEYLYDKNTKTEITRGLPDYLLINFNVSQMIAKHFKIFVQVNNVTDVDYDEGQGPMPGRNFLIGIEGRW